MRMLNVNVVSEHMEPKYCVRQLYRGEWWPVGIGLMFYEAFDFEPSCDDEVYQIVMGSPLSGTVLLAWNGLEEWRPLS
jgi:hypothetical protein